MKKIFVILVVFLLFLSFGCGGGSSQGGNQSKTYSLTVEVIDRESNLGISGATVVLDSKTGTTDNSGKYVFNDISSGNYKLKVSKEGFIESSQDVLVENSSKTVTVSLSKATLTGLTNLEKAKSYHLTMTTKYFSDTGKYASKVEIWVDNFGKQERMISYDSQGEIDMEVVVFGDKGVIKSGGEPMPIDATTARGYIESIANIWQGFVDAFSEQYNQYVVTPFGTISIKVSKDNQNGYPTDKVEYSMNVNNAEWVYTGWIINSGEYKGFLTRLLVENKTPQPKEEDLKEIELNLIDFGKSFNISF